MSYTLRFTSNAYQVDKEIAGLLGTLQGKTSSGPLLVRNIEVGLQNARNICQRTFERAMDWADVDFDQQMNLVQWDWKGADGTTRRKNGEVASEPRDIVDMGKLLQSKQRKQSGRNVVDFEWTADHAEGVHDGYKTKSGTLNPARAWTEPTLADIDEVIDGILRNGGK
jgi:hypothetical protein